MHSMPASSQAGYKLPNRRRRKPLQMQRCNQLGAEENGSSPQRILRPICPTRSLRSQPKRLDSIIHGVGPWDDCHGAARFLQSSIFTLGLASSLATSSKNFEDLLLSFPPPESFGRTHGNTTDAAYAFFAF